jgi:DNA-binding MarR family transcriptional regulator
MTYTFLHVLLEAVEKYEKEAETLDMTSFARWILKTQSPTQRILAEQPIEKTDYADLPTPIHLNLLIYRLQRQWELTTKPLFQDNNSLTNLNELRIMACVADKQQPKKNEVINEVLLENTTGTMLIQRLAQRGFLTETPDATDRRAIRLDVTEAGKTALQGQLSVLWQALNPFYAPLEPAEMQQVVDLLRRLDR